MKTISKADTEAPHTKFRGSYYSKPIEVPEGDIHLLEEGEVYEIAGPARIDYRSDKNWCRALLAPETKALHGPLIFSKVTPISEAQWIHEARDYANTDKAFVAMLILALCGVPALMAILISGLVPLNPYNAFSIFLWWIVCVAGYFWLARRRYALAINDVTDIKVPFSPIRS